MFRLVACFSSIAADERWMLNCFWLSWQQPLFASLQNLELSPIMMTRLVFTLRQGGEGKWAVWGVMTKTYWINLDGRIRHLKCRSFSRIFHLNMGSWLTSFKSVYYSHVMKSQMNCLTIGLPPSLRDVKVLSCRLIFFSLLRHLGVQRMESRYEKCTTMFALAAAKNRTGRRLAEWFGCQKSRP